MSYTQNFFSRDFYPTPFHVIEMMLEDIALEGKTILEPSAGKGDIVDFCIGAGAHLLACEKHPDLRTIVEGKCKVLAEDFLQVRAQEVSHIDMIVMNPPFQRG
jgi:tRNA1(Val) A37 N6-methylase TrmN6